MGSPQLSVESAHGFVQGALYTRTGVIQSRQAPFGDFLLPVPLRNFFRIQFGPRRQITQRCQDALELLQVFVSFGQDTDQFLEGMPEDLGVGARGYRQLVVVIVEEKGALITVEPNFPAFQNPSILVFQEREENFVLQIGLCRMPIDVKVRRVGRAGPILQDIRPPWVRVAYAHVVGYGVQKQSHAPGSQGVTENVKVPVSPKLRIELAVIANVIAVGAARSSFQKGRGVAVADTEVVQVIEQRGGIREGEAAVELQAVGSARDAFGCQRFFGRGDNAILFHHCPV